MDSQKKYNQKWFKERAFKSLKKISEGNWDYSDPLLLYIASGAKMYESIQEIDTPYFKLVTKPEREYLKSIANNIADILPDVFEYIDLGPGTEHKEQFLFNEFKKKGKQFTYIPVDISDYFLDIAEQHALKQHLKTKKIKSSFEELPDILGKSSLPRFVSLIGLTFSNYAPQDILNLLKNISGENGYILIDAQMRDRIDMSELQDVYQNDVIPLVDKKIELIGLNPNTDISPRIVYDGFRVWCSVIKSNGRLEKIGIKAGDKLMVLQSLRYTKESLESELKNFKHELFDTGSSFIASVIKN